MDQKQEQINTILLKIENLMLKQQGFEAEINALRTEVRLLQGISDTAAPTSRSAFDESHQKPIFSLKEKPTDSAASVPSRFTAKFNSKTDFEKFIGENLISKIGILILIIGVGIGAKLAIDKGLISATTRIILGYVVGTALMGLAIKLKKNYLNFSAVLLSGSIAILYFITYAAHAYYQLIPQLVAFGMMVIFTGFAVVASIKYNKSIIANIGLVGAYAVPFLLSDGSGKVEVLFTYIGIINLGILTLAFSRYWKSLFYLSFCLTWLIFLGWHFSLKDPNSYFKLSLIFAALYFITFYVTNIAYKIVKKETFGFFDVTILLLNSFIFYSIGYNVFNSIGKSGEFLGLFTVGNAIFHSCFALIVHKRELADRNLFYFIVALVITFITMAVPVQLNGNWVTIFWSIETAALFIFAHQKKLPILEKLSFPLVFLAFFSLIHDWVINIDFFNYGVNVPTSMPFLNIGFVSACIVTLSLAYMFFVNRKTAASNQTIFGKILGYALPTMLIIITYCTFRIELATFFENLYQATKLNKSAVGSEINLVYNEDYPLLSACCAYIFTFIFASALTFLNLRYFKSKVMANVNVFINLVVILAFLTYGLLILSELRDNYLLSTGSTTVTDQFSNDEQYFTHGIIDIIIRYVSYLFFGILVWSSHTLSKNEIFQGKLKTAVDYLLHLAVLWLLSSELLNILALNGLANGYKFGLSILWGSYALLLIGLGLWKKKKHLRIGAIALLGVTLIKLFAYDISNLDTIAKTIVLVALGALLLTISFLYNKYKHLVTHAEND